MYEPYAHEDIELIGLLFHRDSSESRTVGPSFDTDFVRRQAQAFDAAGFDRVLVGQNSFWPDSLPLAVFAAAVTKKLQFMVAHRPGFLAPTMAARAFATLDQLSNGRAGIHIISASNDAETQCDGDFLSKDERYRRSREFVTILKSIWTSEDPITFEGDFFRFNCALAEVKPIQKPHLPIFFGGTSDLAVQYAGECADVYALGGGLDMAEDLVSRVRASATAVGREIGFLVSLRVIIDKTEEAAWQKAESLLEKIVVNSNARKQLVGKLSTSHNSSGREAMKKLVVDRDLIDRRLWTAPAKATNFWVPPVLVGSAEQVAEALLDYYNLGIRGFLVRGFEPLDDIAEFGRELFPRFKKLISSSTV